MARFIIESRNTDMASFTVRATNYAHAAQIGARRLYKRKRGLHAIQVTGDSGKSGYWQAYLPVSKGTGSSSYGQNFHVREA